MPDITYDLKYGVRDHRGGGRSSARETACRVAAGAIARAILGRGVHIRAATGADGAARHRPRALELGRGRCQPVLLSRPPKRPQPGEPYLAGVRRAGSSIGAVIEVVAYGVPPGLGAPVYAKLDGEIAGALMGINAVKGVEIGEGFGAASLSGEENADTMRMEGGRVVFASNHAGGILGGISTGQPIIVRFAVKPTSSILTPVETVNRAGQETEIVTGGRPRPLPWESAPCPVGEAMLACVLADHLLPPPGAMPRRAPFGGAAAAPHVKN